MNNKSNKNLITKINKDLLKIYDSGPKILTQTYSYVLSGKGKRIRPLLTLLTSNSLFGEYKKAYKACLAIEILHNFTLIHDDIMDNDSIRHGKKTVHEKWDDSTAILAGDAMLSISLNLLTDANYDNKIITAFHKGLLTVCEGQALDKEFETKKNISEQEYLNMVEKKTSYLIAMAIEIGALAYDFPKKYIKRLFKFGLCIGKAFQIQDDFLEIISNSKNMKKSLNSDIILGKKTYPIIICKQHDKTNINRILKNKDVSKTITDLRQFIFKHNIDKKIKQKIDNFYIEGLNYINNIPFKTNELLNFSNSIKERNK